MDSEVGDFVVKKKWSYREQGDELIITPCPYCGDDKGRFNINKLMGLFQCFSCEERGNLWQLKKHCGDIEAPSKVAEAFGEDISYDVVSREEIGQFMTNLASDAAAVKWLRDRGISDETIEHFCLGLSYEQDGRYIVFPYADDGKWVNLKFRSLPPQPKQFRIRPKHAKPLFNVTMIAGLKEVLVVEGEIDCLSAYTMGYRNVCSLFNGAGNFSPKHWDSLADKEKIFFVLDSDGAGRSGVKKIATRLGAERCYDVKIPNGMDLNDLLVKYGAEGAFTRMEACIADSKPIGKGEISSVSGALWELEEHIRTSGTVETGFVTPWPSVNRMCGSVAPGEVMLLQAIPKTGKTTMAQQWLAWLAQTHNIPTMMYCLEMPLWRLAQSLVAGTTTTPRNVISTLEVKMTLLQYRDVPFYYGAMPQTWDFEHIAEVVTYSVKRYGVQFLCFDNLQLLCRSKKDTWTEQAAVSRNFKQLAGKLDIAILLVVQPKKIDPRSMPGMYDPSGSGSIIADADSMMTMWRKPRNSSETIVEESEMVTIEEDSFGPETLIRIPASRYRPGGQALLHFNGEIATLTECNQG